MRFGHKFDEVRYQCPECDNTVDIATMEQEHFAIGWCPCGTIFAVQPSGEVQRLGHPFWRMGIKDTVAKARMREEIAVWVKTTGLDKVRKVLADGFKADLDDLGSLDTLDIAEWGFTGAFEMGQDEIVDELLEMIIDDPQAWKDYREEMESWISQHTN